MCIPSDFALLLTCCQHGKRRYEHDPSGRGNHEIIGLNDQLMVVKVGQAKPQPTIQFMLGYPTPDRLNNLLELIEGERASLVDQLSKHAIAFLLVHFVRN